MKPLKYILNFLAPKECFSCGQQGNFLCKDCFEQIPNNFPYCYICKKPSKDFKVHSHCKKWVYFNNVIVPFSFKHQTIRTLIHHWKFYKKKEIFEEIGSLNSNYFQSFIGNDNYDVTFVPLYFLRKWKRGYNQSEILSHIMFPQSFPLLKRSRHTCQQSHLSKKDRNINVKDAFKVRLNMNDKRDKDVIILVDDVASTGATLNECAKVLKEHGYKKVICCVLASD